MTRKGNLRNAESSNSICVGDCCINAVRRAYSGMMECGRPESAAYDAALAVFAWHHPEVAFHDAETLVRRWILEQSVH